MKKFILLFIFPSFLIAQTKALVGGTLIDGYGNLPLKNSVIIIEGETIVKVGTVDNTSIPEHAEIISTEGMSVLPGLW
ncbi:MAG: Xaa-Pro dipeptidase, partial [Flavobacteriaceae bacterium]|nr:Xaa-Pro dipeptidase [Flavobacteriaceae bacterium]